MVDGGEHSDPEREQNQPSQKPEGDERLPTLIRAAALPRLHSINLSAAGYKSLRAVCAKATLAWGQCSGMTPELPAS
jgi:hypothetical protein